MPQRIPIRFIIFDLGGVVMHGGYLDFLKHYCLKCLTPLGHKTILRLEREVNLGNITENEFYREIERVFGVHLKPKQMHDIIVKKMQTDKALIHLIPKLRRAKIALFTNSLGEMATEVLRLRQIPTRKLFTKVFVSSRLHMAKPDQSAYRFVLHKLRARPRETLIVDDRAENIRGEKKIGMQGIVYKNARQFQRALKKYSLI